MTVSELKKVLKDLPDSTNVYYEDVVREESGRVLAARIRHIGTLKILVLS